jgi:hypothetical protein
MIKSNEVKHISKVWYVPNQANPKCIWCYGVKAVNMSHLGKILIPSFFSSENSNSAATLALN